MVVLPTANNFYDSVLNLEEIVLENIHKDTFINVALEASKDFNIGLFNNIDTLKDCLKRSRDIRQYYGPAGFGKFNLTLVNNGSFFIIIMFMDGIGTEIHDHPFQGIFTSLGGSPIESTYLFYPEKTINDRITTGRLVLEKVHQILPGEFVQINPETIHMLSRPIRGQYSMLIAKTTPSKKNNSFFLHPGLKIQNASNSDFMSRIIKLIQLETSLDKSICTDLNLTEVLEIYMRIGPQLAQLDLPFSQQVEIKNFLKEELSKTDIWNHLMAHENYLLEYRKKMLVLFEES